MVEIVIKGMKFIRKWYRVLATMTAFVGVIYPLLETLDSYAITNSHTEFEVLTVLLIAGLLVTLLLLVLVAVHILFCGSIQLFAERTCTQHYRQLFLMVRPPGPAVLVSLRI